MGRVPLTPAQVGVKYLTPKLHKTTDCCRRWSSYLITFPDYAIPEGGNRAFLLTKHGGYFRQDEGGRAGTFGSTRTA